MITTDKVKYGGCYSLEISGYRKNHRVLEVKQLFEYHDTIFAYLSNMFANEPWGKSCDSYDIRIGVSEVAEPEE